MEESWGLYDAKYILGDDRCIYGCAQISVAVKNWELGRFVVVVTV